jgi:hypothetical protein
MSSESTCAPQRPQISCCHLNTQPMLSVCCIQDQTIEQSASANFYCSSNYLLVPIYVPLQPPSQPPWRTRCTHRRSTHHLPLSNTSPLTGTEPHSSVDSLNFSGNHQRAERTPMFGYGLEGRNGLTSAHRRRGHHTNGTVWPRLMAAHCVSRYVSHLFFFLPLC